MREAERLIEDAGVAGAYELNLYGCRLTEVPESLRDLTSLTSLRLGGNKLTSVPAWLGELTRLVSLDLSGNKLSELPEAIGNLSELMFLELHINKLTELPASMASLSGLEWLNLNGNKLTTMPEALTSFSRLVRLDLSANKFTSLPETLGDLTNLVRLDVGDNKLTAIPETIGNLTDLRYLSLHSNRLTTLPETIGNLTKLIELDLHSNLLTVLPARMAELAALTWLSLFDNRISTRPDILDRLTNLTELSLLGNPLPISAGEFGYPEPIPLPPPEPERSSWFYTFVNGLDAPIRSKDDIDEYPGIGALHLLDGEELVEAENLLIAELAKDDGRAANALADIRCTRAIPALAERAAASPSPVMREFAERALRTLRLDWSQAGLIDRLRTGDTLERIDAAHDLARMHPGPEAEAALEEVVFGAPDDAAGVAALDALFFLRDLLLYDVPFRSMLHYLKRRAVSQLPSVRDEAQAELRTLFTRWAAGETPARLGLTWRADKSRSEPLKRIVASMDGPGPPWEESLSLEEFTGLTGRQRKWVEDVLLSQLPDDPMAVRAVRRLGVRRAGMP